MFKRTASSTIVLTSVFFLSLICVSCAGKNAAPHSPGASAESTTVPAAGELKAAGDARVGDTTLCPVSKERFKVTAASPNVEHKGKTYYFCCAGCDSKFSANPEKYLGTSL